MLHDFANSNFRKRPQLERLENRCLMATLDAGFEVLSSTEIADHLVDEHSKHHAKNSLVAFTSPSSLESEKTLSDSSVSDEEELVLDHTDHAHESEVSVGEVDSGVDAPATDSAEASSLQTVLTANSLVDSMLSSVVANSSFLGFVQSLTVNAHSHSLTAANGSSYQVPIAAMSDSSVHSHVAEMLMAQGMGEASSIAGSQHTAQPKLDVSPQGNLSRFAEMAGTHGNDVVSNGEDISSHLKFEASMAGEMNPSELDFISNHDMLLAEYCSDEQPERDVLRREQPTMLKFAMTFSPTEVVRTPISTVAPEQSLETAMNRQLLPNFSSRGLACIMIAGLSGYLAHRLEKNCQAPIRVNGLHPNAAVFKRKHSGLFWPEGVLSLAKRTCGFKRPACDAQFYRFDDFAMAIKYADAQKIHFFDVFCEF